MTDNQLLTAISDMLDEKLSKELQPIKEDIASIKNDLTGVKLHIENVTERNISIFAENI